MSEEDKHKLSKILYYSDIHPVDTEFINNIIYDLQQENKQLQERIDKAIEYIKSRARNAGVQLMPREKELLEILRDEDIEFDMLKALNTDLDDDIEMG